MYVKSSCCQRQFQIVTFAAQKGPLSGLRQFLTTAKMFNCFMLKSSFVIKTLTFLSWFFGYMENRIDKKAKVNFKIYDVTDWAINDSCNIAQYLEE